MAESAATVAAGGMPAGAATDPIRITLAICAGPRDVREHVLYLPQGTTVHRALEDARGRGWLAVCAAGESEDASLPQAGIWGRVADPTTVLGADDRLEVYRPLQVDPKVARRERFARQGARSTGLFARQRPGGKAGY